MLTIAPHSQTSGVSQGRAALAQSTQAPFARMQQVKMPTEEGIKEEGRISIPSGAVERRALHLYLLGHRGLLQDVHEHRQHKGSSLATPGLSKADNVALLKTDRDGSHLDR